MCGGDGSEYGRMMRREERIGMANGMQRIPKLGRRRPSHKRTGHSDYVIFYIICMQKSSDSYSRVEFYFIRPFSPLKIIIIIIYATCARRDMTLFFRSRDSDYVS